MDLILENWAEIALALLAAVEIYVVASPSKVDDRWVGYLSLVIRTISGKTKKKA